jgi:hypothetical protein
MTDLVLERVQTLPRRIDEVFRFFADPVNLEAITPPWLHFRIVGSPGHERDPARELCIAGRCHVPTPLLAQSSPSPSQAP